MDVTRGCVVAEHENLGPLKGHHAKGFRPTAIITDAHADPARWCREGGKAKVTDLEIAFLKVLELRVADRLFRARQMDLAVLPKDFTIRANKHRSIEPPGASVLFDLFGIYKVKSYA